MNDYYSILKIDRTCGDGEIIEACKIARNKIPKGIANKDDWIDGIDTAQEILLDPGSRKAYDIELNQWAIDNPPPPDFSAYRQNSRVSWRHLTSSGYQNNPADVLSKLFDKMLYLPDSDVQMPMLLALSLTPSALCDTLPVLFCFGRSGTGKSLTIKVLCKFWGTVSLMASTTPPALRNQISSKGEGRHEKNCFIAWSDFSESLITATIEAILKAYSRAESIVMMSGPEKDGTNQEFCCFGLKAVSSTNPIFAIPRWREMGRRFALTYTEKAPLGVVLTSYDEIDFSGVNLLLENQWNKIENIERYTSIDIRGAAKEYGLPEGVTIDRFDTFADCLRSLVYYNILPSEKAALDYFSEYEAYQNKLRWRYVDKARLLLADICKNAIDRAKQFGVTPVIEPRQLKNGLEIAARDCTIDVLPKPKETEGYMLDMGHYYDRENKRWVLKNEFND
jgi:hypothetical protein